METFKNGFHHKKIKKWTTEIQLTECLTRANKTIKNVQFADVLKITKNHVQKLAGNPTKCRSLKKLLILKKHHENI